MLEYFLTSKDGKLHSNVSLFDHVMGMPYKNVVNFNIFSIILKNNNEIIILHVHNSNIMFHLVDDMSIKLWDWEKKWTCSQVFEGHLHYVMMIVVNPKDNNTFASCSLDKTIKVGRLNKICIKMQDSTSVH